jgi:ATP-dependent DNA helicase RecQ
MRDSVRGNTPAFIVFHDSTLEQIALALPPSLSELSRVKGVGPTKLELYGDAILRAVEQAMSLEDSE